MKNVTIKIPRMSGEEEEVFVGLNGKGYRIKRGVAVTVPEGVAEILENAEKAVEILDKFNDSAARKG